MGLMLILKLGIPKVNVTFGGLHIVWQKYIHEIDLQSMFCLDKLSTDKTLTKFMQLWHIYLHIFNLWHSGGLLIKLCRDFDKQMEIWKYSSIHNVKSFVHSLYSLYSLLHSLYSLGQCICMGIMYSSELSPPPRVKFQKNLLVKKVSILVI